MTVGYQRAEDIDASYNYTMGFFSNGSYNTFRDVTGRRNTIQLIKLDDGANHNLVDGRANFVDDATVLNDDDFSGSYNLDHAHPDGDELDSLT